MLLLVILGCVEDCHEVQLTAGCQRLQLCCSGDSCTFWGPTGDGWECFTEVPGDCEAARYDATCALCDETCY